MNASLQKILEVKQLKVSADTTTLVEPISLTLHKGEPLVILGETGSGKSLLAQAIMGILPKGLTVTGEIVLFDNDKPRTLTAKDFKVLWGKQFAMLAQEPTLSLDPTMSVVNQTIEGFYFIAGKDKTTSKSEAYALLTELGLDKFADFYPHQLSGGMAQRAAFAVASAGGASLVIADEPTKGLDAKNRQTVIDLLKQVPQKGGTLLVITHDIEVAEQLGGQLMVMKKGELLEQGQSTVVLDNPTSDYAKALIFATPKHWQAEQKQTISNDKLLTLNNISLKRGSRTLFDKLSCDIYQGETVGLIGQSGIGKSSLGDAICGLIKPATGSIDWYTKPKRHQILKLYQDPPSAFATHLPLSVLLDDVIDKYGLDRSRMPYLMESLKLAPSLLGRTAHGVSGGELQRIAILRALLLNPILLFADEVTSRLDPITQKETMALLSEQCKANNCTLIIVSHDHDLTKFYADKVIDLTDYRV